MIHSLVKRKKLRRGCKVEEAKYDAFLLVTTYLEESGDEQIAIIDLVKKMDEYLKLTGSMQEAYGVQYMKQKLKDHFGDKVLFTNLEGKKTIVTFRTTAASIMNDYYKSPKGDNDDETRHIIETAAKLMKNDIKALDLCTKYPVADDLTIENAMTFLPDSLVQFLQIMVAGKNTEKTGLIGACYCPSCKTQNDDCTPAMGFSYTDASPIWL